MGTTIDSLDIQITTSAGSSAVNIERLATALGKLKENGKLTTVTNNLTKLSTALDKLNSSSTSGISKIAQSLSGLSSFNASGFKTTVNALNKIPKILDGLDTATLDKFKRKMEEVAKALAPLATKIDAVANGFSRLPSRVKSVVSATNSATNSTKSFGGALSSLNTFATIQNLQELTSAINFVADAISAVISKAIEWDGIQFRFGRAFGEDAEETYDYIQKINDVLGINIQEFMQYSSLYGSLLSGFGIEQKKITAISTGLTELSYDIWAAYNDRFKSLESASEAVRSAITGEIEPIRNAGIALTEASLQEYIDSTHLAGISIEKLSEAQKAEVRYAAMVNAAMNQGIVGTYAKEMHTAEGAVRSFSQSMKTLSQAFGSLFIPVIQVVVPYVTAFVEILTDAVRWVANLFGIELFKIDWSNTSKGVGGLADGATDAATGLGKASEAAKKLKNYTMGFDELNVIDPNSGSGSGGSSGKGGADDWGAGLDLDSLWDDSIFAEASARVDEIKKKLEAMLPTIAMVGAAFLAWKFGKKFLEGFDILKLGLKAVAGQSGATSALSLFGLDGLSDKMASLRTLLLKTPIGSLIMGSGSTSVASAVAAIGAVVAAIASIAAGLVLVYKKSENFREGLSAIVDGISWLFDKIGEGFSWIGSKVSEFTSKINIGFLKELDLGLGDILITLGGLALFGPWGLAIEGVVLAIKAIGYAAKDSLQPVDLFGEGISKATKEKVEPFLEKMTELENTLATLDWSNAIVDESDLADISAKLKSITETIVNELDSDKNEALAKIDPLRASMSDEKFAELQQKIEASYAEQTKTVQEGETRINEILAKAAGEARALTDEEASEINKIQLDMKNTGVKYLSESQTESNLILQRMKDNASKLSAQQASDVIKSAKKSRDETIEAANEQYDGIALEAQRLLDTGTINKDEYDAIIKAAEDTRDDTIDAAETQYDDIVKTAKEKMGEYSKYIDEETGDIKSNWEVFCEDLSKWWSDTWDDIKTWCSTKWGEIKWWFKTYVKPYFTKAYWSEKFDTIKQGLEEKLDEAWGKVKDFFDVEEWKKKVKDAVAEIKKNFKLPEFPKIKLSVEWDKDVTGAKKLVTEALGLDGWPKLKWSTYAMGGLPSMGEMFIAREAGPELVGRIGNRSAVVNNDQIVTAVAQGVYSAVLSAMSESNGNGNQNINVYLDGKQIHASVKRTEESRGANIMGNQVGYLY